MIIIKTSAVNVPDGEELSSYIESIKLHKRSDGDSIDKEISKLIDNLPSRRQVTLDMDDTQRGILYDTVGYIWREITGQKISDVDRNKQTTDMDLLDGCYWMMPGGIILAGLNHFAAAKSHRGLICSLLNINQFIFESKIATDPDSLIGLIIARGGIRMLVRRGTPSAHGSVHIQTTKDSWTWARDKLQKMYHKKKVIKILDDSKPYNGWKSGVPIVIK
jgi:hypothetical protein